MEILIKIKCQISLSDNWNTKNTMDLSTPGACVINIITVVIYGYRELVFVHKHSTRLERLARDNHSGLLRKPQITVVIMFMIQAPSGQNFNLHFNVFLHQL